MTQSDALRHLTEEYQQNAQQLHERISQLEYKKRDLQNNFHADAMPTIVGMNSQIMTARHELAMTNIFYLRLSQISKLPINETEKSETV